jgi:hypothetical protein
VKPLVGKRVGPRRRERVAAVGIQPRCPGLRPAPRARRRPARVDVGVRCWSAYGGLGTRRTSRMARQPASTPQPVRRRQRGRRPGRWPRVDCDSSEAPRPREGRSAAALQPGPATFTRSFVRTEDRYEFCSGASARLWPPVWSGQFIGPSSPVSCRDAVRLRRASAGGRETERTFGWRRVGRFPTRPVLKHGPRSLTYARVFE